MLLRCPRSNGAILSPLNKLSFVNAELENRPCFWPWRCLTWGYYIQSLISVFLPALVPGEHPLLRAGASRSILLFLYVMDLLQILRISSFMLLCLALAFLLGVVVPKWHN